MEIDPGKTLAGILGRAKSRGRIYFLSANTDQQIF